MIGRRRAFAAFAIALAVAGCRTELYSDLPQAEANEMVSVLRLAGIDATRAPGDGGMIDVLVTDADFARAVTLLREHGLPRAERVNLGEVFSGGGFVTSQTEERARFVYALSEELSQTLSEIDGVLSARTHVVLPTADPLSRSSTPSSASVMIRHHAGEPVDQLLAPIKQLVANGIEGLDYANVSVVFIPVAAPTAVPSAPPTLPAWRRAPGLAIGGALAVLLALCGLGGAIWASRRGRTGFHVEPAE